MPPIKSPISTGGWEMSKLFTGLVAGLVVQPLDDAANSTSAASTADPIA